MILAICVDASECNGILVQGQIYEVSAPITCTCQGACVWVDVPNTRRGSSFVCKCGSDWAISYRASRFRFLNDPDATKLENERELVTT